MVKTVGIAGAGLIGRMLALRLAKDGWHVSLFDKDDRRGRKSCGLIAGGMLSLYSEIDNMDPIVFELGLQSMTLWPKILNSLSRYTHFQVLGSIVVSHSSDLPELERLQLFMRKKLAELFDNVCVTNSKIIQELEPELLFCHGMYLSGEGNIDNTQLFSNLELTLLQLGVAWWEKVNVDKMYSKTIVIGEQEYNFDVVIDCRGLGAKYDILNLRGVRGEIILLNAPQVKFSRPIKMLHPRYSIYVVPRPNYRFVVGASEIESEDKSLPSVQSTLELLSAAYSLHRGFAEARIIKMMSNCRPAFPDNVPKIYTQDHIIRVNGLYRYGYLLAPALVEEVIQLLQKDQVNYPAIHINKY
ncbi:FAD-dependent oxidoreductase [Neoehrlichia mikurensis]|uniref:D-amino-acid oxidase n=1 Tax=Neoehrlichia mikurensis TaxID=89586 RepID=A0A9Q9BUZ1_9RICK|nr:FAD-dependent oxidoreductase [Neoehrlichia mikurensis]QXK91829.1 FAD-dependent oxidoreductase [Neoehrlichia mikurensis]QXK93041.1 FAD-dependent oxidoreductase [Neoehrlichia mikurensis]QXK93519.1 FAD-dependent oxidoreductase [Neoehrlichia mikurensis]UTO55526.1 FAD-dependent oxidoreductase [Neoehrlichia mikurensis]UTO56447.1 FAD-dependent oxidoreductase [Neoehrlichia mikurensis]